MLVYSLNKKGQKTKPAIEELNEISPASTPFPECLLWIENGYSQILFLEKFFSRQNRKGFFTNNVKVGLQSISNTGRGASQY